MSGTERSPVEGSLMKIGLVEGGLTAAVLVEVGPADSSLSSPCVSTSVSLLENGSLGDNVMTLLLCYSQDFSHGWHTEVLNKHLRTE